MFPNIDEYLAMRRASAPTVEVSRGEFVDVLIRYGFDKEAAIRNADLSELLNSAVFVGDKNLKVEHPAGVTDASGSTKAVD